jgi:hypothetical protein
VRHALPGGVSTSYFGQLSNPLVEGMLPLIVWLAAKMLYMPMGEARYYTAVLVQLAPDPGAGDLAAEHQLKKQFLRQIVTSPSQRQDKAPIAVVVEPILQGLFM